MPDLLIGWITGLLTVLGGWHLTRYYNRRHDFPEKAEEVVDERADERIAIPINPNDPPRTVRFKPQPGSTRERPRCTCHGRELEPYEEVLWWPQPEGAPVPVLIFCKDWVDG